MEVEHKHGSHDTNKKEWGSQWLIVVAILFFLVFFWGGRTEQKYYTPTLIHSSNMHVSVQSSN